MMCDKAAKNETDVQPHLSLAISKERKRKRKPTAEDLQGRLTSHEDAVDGGESLVKEEAHILKSKDQELAQAKKGKSSKTWLMDLCSHANRFQSSQKGLLRRPYRYKVHNPTWKGNLEAVNSSKNIYLEGNIEDKELGGCTAETHKKDSEGSATQKSVNAFRRVNPDEVTFADERLQDNSYWAKSGAESGYGAKAQEVLGQVRGKDFRHEKTKKKRGSYKGGLIDLQSHSIKFSYSDDE